jgi:glycosyltransferase involved in cell wall biosynthesis
MVRVRNEAEFLDVAIASIVELFDEVVLIDNASDDDTPQVIRSLAFRYPNVRSLSFPHRVYRPGGEHERHRTLPRARRDGWLLGEYYNWCLARCHGHFVCKWDGDMIAAPPLAPALAEFRRSDAAVFVFRGYNLHPDLDGLIATPGFEHRTWAEVDRSGGYEIEPYTWSEPRLHPRRLARYRDAFAQCERLATPFTARLYAETPLYFHVKFLKRHPMDNWSADSARSLRRRPLVKVPLAPDVVDQVRRVLTSRRRESIAPAAEAPVL